MSSLREQLTLTLGEAVALISDEDLDDLHLGGYAPERTIIWRTSYGNQLCTTSEALANMRLERGRRR